MIYFPPLNTSKLRVQLRELRVREDLEMLAVPPGKNEASATKLLRFAVESSLGENSDPRRWTVQERTLAVAHYLSCVVDDGPNFAVGDSQSEGHGRLLDYLDTENDSAPYEVEAGTHGGSTWFAKQINGAEAEVMEGLFSSRTDWIIADMAVRLRESDEPTSAPSAVDDPSGFSDWLSARVDVFKSMSESDFEALFVLCQTAKDGALHHLFSLGLDAGGYVVLPKGGGSHELAAARFPANSAVGAIARAIGA